MSTNDLWLVARGAGLSALLTLSVATACGALGSLPSAAPGTRLLVQYLHRTAAVLGISLIMVHLASIVADSKSHIGVSGALVPFTAGYRPAAVALGTGTFYLLLLVIALGLARGRLTASPAAVRRWRGLHAAGYLLWATAVTHGLLAGTDRGQHWVILLAIGCVLMVLCAGMVRLLSLPEENAGAPRLADRQIGSIGRPVSRQPRNVLR